MAFQPTRPYQPVTPEQVADILGHIESGLSTREIAEKMDLYPMQVAGVRSNLTLGRYATDSPAAEAAIETSIGLERDLQQLLHDNIGQLDARLRVVGREYSVASGRIDLLCEDDDDELVPIEIKVGECDYPAVAQLLVYIGDLLTTGRRVRRGLIIARSFTPRTRAAVRAAPLVELCCYGVQFTFTRAGSADVSEPH
jgi:RecB family endonuclease NucS